MATPRRRFHIISFNNNGVFTTLAVGGRNDVDNGLNTVEEWQPETEQWSKVESRLKEKKNSFGAIAAPTKLICPSQ